MISHLGPLLFLIYISYLEKNIKLNVNYFADDTMLFSIVNNPAISANESNHDLKVTSPVGLSVEDEIYLNKQATELLFTCKKNSPDHPSLFFQ